MGAVTLIGAALSAASALAGGRTQAAGADFSAQAAQQQAERERDIAVRDAAEHRRQQGRQLAGQRARRAASGVTAEGSALLIDEAAAAEIELGAQEILAGGAARSHGQRQRAALSRSRAEAARTAAYRQAGRTLLTRQSWESGSGGIRL